MAKYNNVKIDGYDSKKEYRRAKELKLLEKKGIITGLQEQVKYELISPQYRFYEVQGVRKMLRKKKLIERGVYYIADFVYYRDGEYIVEDTKGVRTKEYIIKRKLMLYVHGIKIKEDFSKPKIIWGEISDKSKFAFDFLGEYIPEATSFYMKGECIEYLLSALNSSVSEWLFSKVGTTTGVGTIRWKKYTIEQLIVAKLSTEQLNTHLAAFNDLKVGKMSITDFECFSNKLMYDVYKLTSDEIQYIENQQIV